MKNLYYKGERSLSGLYILKFICAIMVVIIHFQVALKPYVLPLCRIAVPIFFIISGYFMVDNDGCVLKEKLVTSFKKILRITIFTSCIYLIYNIGVEIVAHHDLMRYRSLEFWLHEFFFGNSIEVHLWYLTAYLQVLVIFFLALRLKTFSALYLLIPIGYLLNILFGAYSLLMFDESFPPYYSRNALTIGIPCVLIGLLIRYYEHKLPSHRVIALVLLSLIFLLYAEYIVHLKYFPTGSRDTLFFTFPVSVFTFIYFLRLNTCGALSLKLCEWGKLYTLDIYLWHMLVGYILGYIYLYTGLKSTGIDAILIAFMTLCMVIIKKPSDLILSSVQSKTVKNA